jgi:hypothetical protein
MAAQDRPKIPWDHGREACTVAEVIEWNRGFAVIIGLKSRPDLNGSVVLAVHAIFGSSLSTPHVVPVLKWQVGFVV